MLAYTEHQHFSKKITRKKPLAPNDKRCTHAHHLSQNPTPTHMPTGHTSILGTRFSTQHGTLSQVPQPRSYHLQGNTFPGCAKQDTCSPYSYKVEIACMPEHHVAPKGTEQYSTLSDPSTEAPYWVPRTGSSLREYAFVRGRALLLNARALYI